MLSLNHDDSISCQIQRLRRLRERYIPGKSRAFRPAVITPGYTNPETALVLDRIFHLGRMRLFCARRMAKTNEEKSYKFIRFEAAASTAHITLNHPPYNVLTVPMMIELAEAIESLDGRNDIKCILLDSSQRMFSAGISLDDSKPERIFQTLDAFTRVFQASSELAKPLVVVVNGAAVGAGSELAAFGDLVIATPHARFAQPEVRMGTFPPFAAIMLPQVIGPKRAYELILTGEAMTAEEARTLGFVNRVVEESALETTVQEVLARITQFSGAVLEMAKRVISSTAGLPLEQAIRRSQDIYLNQLMSLEDSKEGLRAVIEKRKPVWRNK
jgi:cyclohexa-1,5-dienecarbonyl-CoA hydratase